MKTVFGPVTSRRFGRSLGIDLSADQKSCNFDCLYCELEKGERRDTVENPRRVDEIIDEVQYVFQQGIECDVITVTANGEPTLYPFLDPLVDALRGLKTGKKLLILSNGSTIMNPLIQQTLLKFDHVKLSLDCALQRCFEKIDRPLGVSVEAIIEGMVGFRSLFQGELILEILLVQGVNDTFENKIALYEAMKRIRPDRVDVGTIDRPPAYQVCGVTYDVLEEFAHFFEGLKVVIPWRRNEAMKGSYSDREQLLQMISRRPLGVDEAVCCYDQATCDDLEMMVQEGHIVVKSVGSVKFYCHVT